MSFVISVNSITENASPTQISNSIQPIVANLKMPGNSYRGIGFKPHSLSEASKLEQQRWTKMINTYLETSKKIVNAILVVDIRHTPTKQDVQMLDYLTFANIPVTIVATKYDKIKKTDRAKRLQDIATTLKVGIENIYLISSETAYGKDNIVSRIYQFVDGE